MNKPEVVAIDANACIIHALDLGVVKNRQVRDIDCGVVRGFVNGCTRDQIRIGTFAIAKKYSYNNLAKATRERMMSAGFKDPYLILKRLGFAKNNLDRLFRRLEEFPESYTKDELALALAFFEGVKKDLTSPSGREKSPIPEPEDLQIFVSAHNLWSGETHILSKDRHFTEYKIEIESSKFRVRIVPVLDLPQLTLDWNWPIDN